jgi:hypothetical protein
MKLKEDVEGEALKQAEEDATASTEGMDEAEAALLERQREVAIKRARQGKDVSIAISQRTPYGATAASAEDAAAKQRERPRNQREQPSEREGSIQFSSSETGGPVQICIHSLFASKGGPYRVGLDIRETVNNADEEVEVTTDTATNYNSRFLKKEQSDLALSYLSAFSKEMIRAESLVRTILNSADNVKKEESEFYQQSIRMERSVHLWPMLQLSCLLVAAVIQIRHILKFMKAKHIVY